MPTVHIFLPLVNRADSARGIGGQRWKRGGHQRLGPMAWFFNGFGAGRRLLVGDQLPGWRPWPHPERSWGATGAAEAAESLDSLDSKASGAGWEFSESPAFSEASDPGAARTATSPGGACATPVPSVLSP
mmetsp:Transcript_34697/g.70876  ORF Transcript_34697/g.70876 Transcript_34697/m.70876 type:complete len:130 (-) Transcript_34697:129-518(-)